MSLSVAATCRPLAELYIGRLHAEMTMKVYYCGDKDVTVLKVSSPPIGHWQNYT